MESENRTTPLSIGHSFFDRVIEDRFLKISEWFRERIREKNLDVFFDAILTGDIETFQNELSALLSQSISFMDSKENFYHGFMAGILSRLEGYRVKSNPISGSTASLSIRKNVWLWLN